MEISVEEAFHIVLKKQSKSETRYKVYLDNMYILVKILHTEYEYLI